MTDFRVAIIGAGPAGCLLARLLHLGGIGATIYEGESSPDFRSQGGTLDLHTATGIAAMKEAGLFEEFKTHARYDGQYMAIIDKHLKYHFVKGAVSSGSSIDQRPEIDRPKLREIIAQSLPEGTIKWGHKLQKIDGKTLVFEHTTVTGFGLIVGADGAWSKVRQHVAPGMQPVYMGVATHDFSIPDAEQTVPEVYKIVNHGSLFGSADGQRLTIQQMGDGSLEVYASFVHKDADWMDKDKCSYDAYDLEQAKKAMLKEFREWCPELREAISSAQGKTVPRSVYSLPPGSRWKHTAGFTVIGDAAHLMTPYAGEGVNQALDDARLLARAVIGALKAGKDVDEQVRRFEDVMFARVKPAQQMSHDLCECWFFTAGAPKAVMPKALSMHVNNTLPWILRPVGTAGVYSYFFWRNLLS